MKPHPATTAPHGLRLCSDGIIRNAFEKVPPANRFWKFVDKGKKTECWNWKGHFSGSTSRYPSFYDGNSEVKAHRFSYELHVGPIPEGLLVCHHCDNKSCVNPAHLFVGTHKDNTNDARQKNRLRWGSLHGEKNPRSKWTEQQVRDVVRLWKQGMPLADVAMNSGVTRTSVGAIVEGRVWSKLTGISPRRKHPVEQYAGPSKSEAENHGVPGRRNPREESAS